jgi:hypothetical protein
MYYEYIVAVYVNDLVIASKDPKGITDMLTNTYQFKLKEMGPIDYYLCLGMSFTRKECGQLCIYSQRYIEKMVDANKQMFKENPPSNTKSPLESNDNPETDMMEFHGKDGIQMYQSLIGLMQWAISITTHFNIAEHIMSMSIFRVALH